MFTGIIEGVGRVRSTKGKGSVVEIEIQCDFDLERANVGDSISVNGCCLTITSRLGRSFWAEISPETAAQSTLGRLAPGDAVNLERARILGDRLDGHIVQGHVDGIGKVIDIKEHSGCREFSIEIPEGLSRYVVEKGSVAVDGVSLTVNAVQGRRFSVMVIPHTKLETTFESKRPGDSVNLEVDIIGKYVEKLTFLDSEQYEKGSKITEEFLKKHGF
ncbi:MAG: riboflavin synthase [Proteobacteria bacterium]|nr:riboflavin synthase [Pseudomonadota bacterium]